LLVSSFPETTADAQQRMKPSSGHAYRVEALGYAVAQAKLAARQARKPGRAFSDAFLKAFVKQVGPAGIVMFFPPDTHGGSGSTNTTGTTTTTTTTTGGTGGGPHVSSAPEPATLLAGLSGAGLVGLVLLGQDKKKTALVVRA
jgi:hypothetical protein